MAGLEVLLVCVCVAEALAYVGALHNKMPKQKTLQPISMLRVKQAGIDFMDLNRTRNPHRFYRSLSEPAIQVMFSYAFRRNHEHWFKCGMGFGACLWASADKPERPDPDQALEKPPGVLHLHRQSWPHYRYRNQSWDNKVRCPRLRPVGPRSA